MGKIKIYLDNCCFNRPYDDQSFIKIKIETEAKIFIQTQIKEGRFHLIWSYILDYENDSNPYANRKNSILKWKYLSEEDIEENSDILKTVEELEKNKIFGKDALHIACAIYSKVDFFITTDYNLIRKASSLNNLKVINPVDFINIEEEFRKWEQATRF